MPLSRASIASSSGSDAFFDAEEVAFSISFIFVLRRPHHAYPRIRLHFVLMLLVLALLIHQLFLLHPLLNPLLRRRRRRRLLLLLLLLILIS